MVRPLDKLLHDSVEPELWFCYVVIGERTPVGIRMAGPPANLPEHWMFCHTAREFRAAVDGVGSSDSSVAFPPIQDELKAEELRIRRVVERPDGTAATGEW